MGGAGHGTASLWVEPPCVLIPQRRLLTPGVMTTHTPHSTTPLVPRQNPQPQEESPGSRTAVVTGHEALVNEDKSSQERN